MKRKYIYILGGIFFASALFLLPGCQKQQPEEKKEKGLLVKLRKWI